MAKSSRVATVNLGMQTVTMAVFDAQGGSLRLDSFAEAELIPDPSADSSRAGQLKIAVAELRTKLRWSGGPAACAIPAQGVFARFVKIPLVESDKVGQMLHFEAQQNVPYPIEEVSWAYQVLPEEDADKLGALIIATKLDQLESTVGSLAGAGVSPELIEASTTALYNALRYNYPDLAGCSLLIDIGARATNLLFVEADRLFIRTLPVGGNSITAALQRKFDDRSLSELEHLKRREGFIPPPGSHDGEHSEEAAEVGRIARTVMTRIHNEITRSITFYRTNQLGSGPVRAFLAGGGASLPYALEFFNEKLSLPIEFFNALRRVSVSPTVPESDVRTAAHRLGECVGLASRLLLPDAPLQIELKSKVLESAKLERKRRPFLAAAALVLIATLCTLALYFDHAAGRAETANNELDVRLNTLRGYQQELDAAAQQRSSDLQASADLIAAPLLRVAWAALITEINEVMPSRDVWVTKLRPMVGDTVLEPGEKGSSWGHGPTPNGVAGTPTEPAPAESAITGLLLEGLYLEGAEGGPAIVDRFCEALAKSTFFAIKPETIASGRRLGDPSDNRPLQVLQERATPSGEAWAYTYKLVVPLARPLPL
ncbi:MAG: pilus assembly protein PilM [Chthoniobacterales bacterium]|nr:pilus assembly protein PilM [Chthoniobacterales bacterium]